MNNLKAIRVFICAMLFGTSTLFAQNTSFFVSDPNDAANVKNALIDLNQKGVFSTLHKENIATLSNEHQSYFKNNPQFDLLRYTQGNIFLNDKKDAAFVVYHKNEARVAIVLFNESENTYGELYAQYPVVNELKDVQLPYAYQGTLVYVLGSTLMNIGMLLEGYPLGFLNREPAPVSVYNIAKDPEFKGLKLGNLSKNIQKADVKSCLCVEIDISDFSLECLQYNADKKAFMLIYSIVK